MPETSNGAETLESADQFIDRVLSPEYVRQLMSEVGYDIRRGVFHPVMTLWLMMYQRISDPDPKILMSKLSTELPTTGACLAGVFEYPPYAPIMDNSPWHFMLPPEA